MDLNSGSLGYPLGVLLREKKKEQALDLFTIQKMVVLQALPLSVGDREAGEGILWQMGAGVDEALQCELSIAHSVYDHGKGYYDERVQEPWSLDVHLICVSHVEEPLVDYCHHLATH